MKLVVANPKARRLDYVGSLPAINIRYHPEMDITLDLPDLEHDLWELLAQVPPGRVTTYGDLARALGDVKAAKWVGTVLLHHDCEAGCGCHRVLRAGGELGGYVGEPRQKAERLREDGVRVAKGGVDLDAFGFADFHTARPLVRLRKLQQELLERVDLTAPAELPELVAGVDISYDGPHTGVAGYALVEGATGDLLWSHTVRRPVPFPYITTYLAFRELPLHLALLEEVRAAGKLADVLLVDGSGILHDRHAGVATHLGVVADVPTIGVTKKHLFGEVDTKGMEVGKSRPITHGGETIGAALLTHAGTTKPVYISPGHRTDLAYAQAVIDRVQRDHRLPEPLYWADRLSRDAVKGKGLEARGQGLGTGDSVARS